MFKTETKWWEIKHWTLELKKKKSYFVSKENNWRKKQTRQRNREQMNVWIQPYCVLYECMDESR